MAEPLTSNTNYFFASNVIAKVDSFLPRFIYSFKIDLSIKQWPFAFCNDYGSATMKLLLCSFNSYPERNSLKKK